MRARLPAYPVAGHPPIVLAMRCTAMLHGDTDGRRRDGAAEGPWRQRAVICSAHEAIGVPLLAIGE